MAFSTPGLFLGELSPVKMPRGEIPKLNERQVVGDVLGPVNVSI